MIKEECYSKWKFNKNLQFSIIGVSGTNNYPGLTRENSIDGIYYWNNIGAFHTQSYVPNPFILYELDSIKTIEKVIIKTRILNSVGFTGITIRIGSTTNYLRLFDSHSGPDLAEGTIIEFTGRKGPMKGKFIEIRKETINIVYGEVVFIGF